MDLIDTFAAAGIIVLGFALLFVIMAVLVRWARGRGKGALLVGAFMSVMAPDPTLEQNIKMTEEAQEDQAEEDAGGETKD